MLADITLSVPAAITSLLPPTVLAVDFLIKSALLVACTALAIIALRRFLKSSGRHLFWANVMLSLALLPFLPGLSNAFMNSAQEAQLLETAPPAAFELVRLSAVERSITGQTAQLAVNPDQAPIPWATVLIVLYLLPCLFLLGRLAYSAYFIWQVSCRSDAESDLDKVIRMNRLKKRFNVSRAVVLKFSDRVESPVSFGLLHPQIVFPESARDWPDRVFESALLHEFAHIQRLDWLTSAFAYFICCFYWINPCVWYAWRQLNQEAENACDASVVQTGVSGDDYAEDLLTVTRSCRHSPRPKLLVQSVFGSGTLKRRVELLLTRESESAPQSILARILLMGGSALMLVLFSSSSVIGVHALTALDIGGEKSLSGLWSNYRSFERRLEAPAQSVQPVRGRVQDYSMPELQTISRVEPVPEVLYKPGNLAVASRSSALRPNSAIQLEFVAQESGIIAPRLNRLDPQLSIEQRTPATSGQLPFLITTSQSRVESMSKSEIRSEIERVETEFFSRFNDRVEDKQLHVYCDHYRPPGSYIQRWACEPRFVIDGRSESNRELMSSISIGSAIGGAEFGRGNTREDINRLSIAIDSVVSEDEEMLELYRYMEILRSI